MKRFRRESKMNIKKMKRRLQMSGFALSTAIMTGVNGLTAHASLTPTVDENTVKTQLYSGFTSIKAVLTAIVVVVGIIAALKIVIAKLPSIDDPHVKSEMWKGIGGVITAVGGAAVLIWVAPYIWGIFYH